MVGKSTQKEKSREKGRVGWHSPSVPARHHLVWAAGAIVLGAFSHVEHAALNGQQQRMPRVLSVIRPQPAQVGEEARARNQR